MKALNPSTGNLEEVYVKALDGMPVGTIVEYSGQASDIPTGWEVVSGQNKIQKTIETRPLGATVVNQEDDSQINAYSTEYINDCKTYSSNETFTGKYWVDGSKIYRKVFDITTDVSGGITGGSQITLNSIPTSFADSVDKIIYGSIVRTGTNCIVYWGINYIQKIDNDRKIALNPSYTLAISNTQIVYLIIEYTKIS